MMVQHDRLIFLAVHVNDFFPFGNGCQRLIDDLQRLQRFRGGAKLAQAAVNEDQAGKWAGGLTS
jgi:hypothetical protein